MGDFWEYMCDSKIPLSKNRELNPYKDEDP